VVVGHIAIAGAMLIRMISRRTAAGGCSSRGWQQIANEHSSLLALNRQEHMH
jgi:hypothetical protein